MGRQDDASTVLADSREIDGLDAWLRDLAGLPIDADEQTHLDVALEYRASGTPRRPGECWRHPALRRPLGAPRAELTRALLLEESPDDDRWLFPNRLDEHDLLLASLGTGVGGLDDSSLGALSFTALGCWYYAHDRAADAIAAWENAVSSDPTSWQAWRNLGLAHYNTGRDLESARSCYARALALRPHDDRLAYEADQLASLAGVPIDRRLDSLSPDGVLLDRDDAPSSGRT